VKKTLKSDPRRCTSNFLPWSVISRPIMGKAPTIDLVVGYHHANDSPLLKRFLSKTYELIRRVADKAQ
jgi:LysR family hca operon transcriptional activator